MTPIFFDQRQSVPDVASYSPSAGKPARFAELMQHYDFRSYGQGFSAVVPVTREDLLLAHSPEYVDGVFAGTVMNGFDNFDPRVPEACLWGIGSLLDASKHAMGYPAIPACSASSGYHHACYSEGGGYCTFNGLMVVAAKLIAENPKCKVAILDLDMHYGQGTASILLQFPALYKQIHHHSNGEHWYGNEDPAEWFIWLQECIDGINAFKPDLVLYQAGADMHILDPLGGLLNDSEMEQRDRSVFRKIRAPVAWCLAGGYRGGADLYTDATLQTHRATLMESKSSVAHRIELLKDTK